MFDLTREKQEIFYIQYLFTDYSMPIYQVRRFIKLEEPPKVDFDSLTDIYIYRKGQANVGIKFRDPKKKGFGWELTDLECKVAENQNVDDQILEKWQKYYLELPKKIKLKTQEFLQKEFQASQINQGLDKLQGKPVSKEQEQKYQSKCPIKQKMRKKKQKLCLAVRDCLRASKIKNNKSVADWCIWEQEKLNLNQFKILIVSKDKSKIKGTEIGHIKIQSLDLEIQPLFFETHCFESKNLEAALKTKRQYGQNVSYPKLFEIVFFCNSKKIKENF